MHKTNYIKLYAGGGDFMSLLSGMFNGQKPQNGEIQNAQLAEGIAAANDPALQQADPGGTVEQKLAMPTNMGSSRDNLTQKPPSNGLSMTQMGGITNALLSGYGAISNASKLPSQSQKTEAIADGAVDAIGTGLSALGPWGMVAGTALKLVNGIGGSLMNNNATAKMAKDFKINDTVGQSSGYGGITAGAQSAMGDGQGYRKAGLFGKLFTNTGNLQGEMKESARLQNQASGILNTNKQAIEGGTASAGMMQNNMVQKNYNSSAWQNGSVTFGKKGTVLQAKSGIYIKPENKGKFTATKKATGKSTEELTHSSNPVTKKRAIFAENAKKWHHEDGGTLATSGSNDTKTESWKKLGKASKQLNLKKIKHQFGGALKKDHTEYKHDIVSEPEHGYTKWVQSLPQRLQETNDYDLKGYFNKYGPVEVVGDNHLTDEFKKPNHVTFSTESIYNSPEHHGGEWRQGADKKWEFVASPWNIKNVGLDSLQSYFKQNEPSSRLILPVPSHKDGGAINVIADGAFHSRKHKLKDNPELADANITLKGIPVVSEEEGGEITQHAEVEKDELILHYDLTKQLELLFKEGTDEAAIQAGRILSKEIVKNTKDSSSNILKKA